MQNSHKKNRLSNIEEQKNMESAKQLSMQHKTSNEGSKNIFVN